MKLDNIAQAGVVLITRKSTAQIAQVVLIFGALYLIFVEESPYALLFQTPVAVVGIILNTFWLMELSDREKRK